LILRGSGKRRFDYSVSAPMRDYHADQHSMPWRGSQFGF
jgi:hypothetical protein